MPIYTIEDSQQRTVGVFTDFDSACEGLIEWASCVDDEIELVRCPAMQKGVSSTEAYIKGYNGGMTVELWVENELV